ncbi:lipopolysaccharide assembly protein LapA domain-containing protein [Telmatospirillum siberiense]|uniref:DUF1049 domain-containing protein n=1 Tax=Telmatospirillum siberiense TaxID=382514 RepID=A0A2N3PSN2_9PROT|nr:lipopolysaccharide assembly protein LapA domain-containing protein [Telmatospirillum siberiense]PKU23411.1 DUF1049 domain-containing protein [Telmatospirillum siberiense]
MKIVSWVVGLPLAVVVVLFALSNRQGAIIGLWPFEDGMDLPVYLIALAPLIAGFLAGAAFAGFKGLKYRRTARRQTKRVADLERQLEAARPSASPADLALPPPLSGDRA